MEKKQTAVDWLFLMINNPNDNQEMALKCLEKAKQMEKEQLDYAYLSGSADNMNDEGSFEQHYNETYGGQDEK